MKRLPEHQDCSPLGLPDALGALALLAPDEPALVFLEDGATESGRLSRGQLHLRAMQTAAVLRERRLVGERVLLAFPSSLDYVVAFLGCMYAGVIAIPVYPPRQNWHAQRLAVIARDAGASVVLTSDSLRDDIHTRLQGEIDSLITISLDALLRQVAPPTSAAPDQAGWINDDIDPQALAYLQYTSGSTGDPKGVMISHANVLANTGYIAESAGITPGGAHVSWLPIYHDMGLVMGILLPLVMGATAVFMPPVAFVQQPLNWLRALDRYRGRCAAAPNFAYALCAARCTPEQAALIDLSNWEFALNGAEPITAAAIDAFNSRFASARPGLISGGFGMAEATLVATIGRLDAVNPRLWVDKSALESHRVARSLAGDESMVLCSSGRVQPGFDLCCVDPQTCVATPLLTVGEIWLAGTSVAAGYWQRPDDSEATFGARILGASGDAVDRRWLRTGDLGFVHEGHLYVTGRLNDLVIVRGANHYPQDLERTAEQAYAGLRQTGFGAAFTQVDAGGETRLVVVQEVDRAVRRQIDVAAATRAIAEAIAREHGIDVDLVVLVPPASVPKTSSGKIQRRACRAALSQTTWVELGRWERPRRAEPCGRADLAAGSAVAFAHADPLPWLRECVAGLVARSAVDIETHRSLVDQGLDSMKLVELTALIAQASGKALPATVAFDHPTLAALAAYLARSETRATVPDAGTPNRPVARAEPIAIIGMDCRVPGAVGLERFWALLCNDDNPVHEATPARKALTGWRAAGNAGHRHVGWLDDVDRFDAAAFGISPREARSMDPQQRLLLETTWHALERAHIAPDSLAGTPTGVFIGICSNDYYRLQREQGATLDAYSGTGGALSIAANRVSYCFGLTGPSLAIDTACSSSLVAIHQACSSLAAGDCELALAGGVNLVLGEDLGTVFESAGMLASDGRCKTFDAAADGYVRSEGCGVLVLKRLRDAQRDGDPILAVLAGSAINQDGASNGLTAPSGAAQQRVVRRALERAGVAASALDLIETHGTGTPLGDPIEVHALRAVVGDEAAAPAEPCWLGAVKSRIGHLEAAAGVAGVIKVVLAMRHGLIPANRPVGAMNSMLDFGTSRLRIVQEAVAWPQQPDRARRAGVSSFGFGGTNAHVILEEAPALPEPPARVPVQAHKLHTLSAASPQALRALAEAHADALDGAADAPAANALSHVANNGRARLAERLSVCAADAAGLAAGLRSWARSQAPSNSATVIASNAERPRHLAFLFTGQGSPYAGMGAELAATEPVFRQALERCAAVLEPLLDVPLHALLYGSETARLADTRYAQPALAALQISLVALWAHYGVVPAAVAGHSVGEYAAAVCCGVMTPATALTLVTVRARLMSQAAGRGAMLSVARSEAEVLSALGSLAAQIDVAASNSPRQTVLSGDDAAITEALVCIDAAGFPAQRLAVSHAFHSRLMDPVLAEFAPHARAGEFAPPTLPWALTGGDLATDPTAPDYWVQQIRKPVRFADALRALERQGVDAFVEIGPGSALLSFARDTLGADLRIASLAGPGRDTGHPFAAALGAWWVAGGAPALGGLHAMPLATPVGLPLRAFKDARHWFQPGAPVAHGAPLAAADAMPGTTLPLRRVDLAQDAVCVFETVPAGTALAALRDHVVAGAAVMPAAGWISLAVAALRRTQPAPLSCTLTDVQFERPMALAAQPAIQTALHRLSDASGAHWGVSIAGRSGPADAWSRCAQADARSGDARPGVEWQTPALADDWVALPATDFYAGWSRLGLSYGPAFQQMATLALRRGETRAELMVPAHGISPAGMLDPAWLDCAFQSVGSVLLEEAAASGRVPVPVRVDSFWVAAAIPDASCTVNTRLREHGSHTVVVDLHITAPGGEVVVQAKGLTLRWIDGLVDAPNEAGTSNNSVGAPVGLYKIEWQPLPLSTEAAAPCDWWVISDACEHAETFIEVLRREGTQARHFGASLLQPETFAAAFEALKAGAEPGRRQGLLVAPSANADAPMGFDESEARHGIALCRALQSLLVAGQALASPALSRVCLLTAPAASAPHHGGAAAMWRSAAQELRASGVTLTLGECPSGTAAADAPALAAALAAGALQWRVCMGRLEAPRFIMQTHAGATAAKLNPGRSVLLSGGTGALGLHVAERLVDRGAPALWLLARRAELSSNDLQRIESWRARGCAVEVVRADVAVRTEVECLLARIQASAHPLGGVVHAAGANADALLPDLDDTRWEAALNGKVFGGLWLDQLTRHLDLDFFIAFSSAAVALGSAGQCNYAAANGLLEQIVASRVLATHSRERTVALQWGPWEGAGLADAPGVRAALKLRGIGGLGAHEALDGFEQSLSGTASALLVGRFDESSLAAPPSLATARPAASARPTLQALIAKDRPACINAIRQALADALVRVLDLGADTSLARQPDACDALRLSSLGLDSLMAMEVRNELRGWIGVDLPAHLLIGNTQISEVIALLYQKVMLLSVSSAPDTDAADAADMEMEVL